MSRRKDTRRERAMRARLEDSLALQQRMSQRAVRIEHEVEELRVRLEALAFQARRHAPPSIKDHQDLWVVALEAMAERCRKVAAVAAGSMP